VLDHACQSGRHPLIERKGDAYDTPTCAIEALLQVERLPRRIWEPACGTGNIVTVLRAAGHEVIATDLVDRGCPDSEDRIDFLMPLYRISCDAIVTNPPFRHAERFVALALDQAPLVVMLLRLAFLESERRSPLLDGGKLARVHVFAKRLPMMHREGWNGPRSSSAIPFAWFVWCRDHYGPAIIDRLHVP